MAHLKKQFVKLLAFKLSSKTVQPIFHGMHFIEKKYPAKYPL